MCEVLSINGGVPCKGDPLAYYDDVLCLLSLASYCWLYSHVYVNVCAGRSIGLLLGMICQQRDEVYTSACMSRLLFVLAILLCVRTYTKCRVRTIGAV